MQEVISPLLWKFLLQEMITKKNILNGSSENVNKKIETLFIVDKHLAI